MGEGRREEVRQSSGGESDVKSCMLIVTEAVDSAVLSLVVTHP